MLTAERHEKKLSEILTDVGFLGWVSILAGLGLAAWLARQTLPKRPDRTSIRRGILLGAIPLALGVLGAGLRFQSVQIELQRHGEAWAGLEAHLRENWIDRFLLNVWVGLAAALIAWLPLWIAKVRWKRFD